LNSFDEATLWERLSQARQVPLEPAWLGEVYSPSLSLDLRHALCERLGMLAERGWPHIHRLLEQYGAQRELVLSAGLCHQPKARDWLLKQLEQDDDFGIQTALEALACWGAEVPCSVISDTLNHPSQQRRLAGLQLLTFHAYLLNDDELLQLCEQPLQDFRDPVVIETIRVLQRRDGTLITDRLAALIPNSSDAIARAALLALGCIATPTSQRWLLELSQSLPEGERRQLACKQLGQQFRS
tara:strand:+ start:510 stop:1232 length:723 start_codon:yes stop_codon:yes gene_type:complete